MTNPIEYIDKQKLLEWLAEQKLNKDCPYEVRYGFIQVINEVKSGTFDDHTAQEEMAKLKAERDSAIKRMNNTVEAWNEQNQEIQRLEIALGAANCRDEGNYYAWMPNEENCLETLSCNVMIPAEWIRNLIDEGKQIAEARAIQAERERDALHHTIADAGPDGRNYTNDQFNRLQVERDALLERLKKINTLTLDGGISLLPHQALNSIHGITSSTIAEAEGSRPNDTITT